MSTTPVLFASQSQANIADAAAAPGGTNTQSDGQIIRISDDISSYAVVWTDGSRTHYPSGNALVARRYDHVGNPIGGEVRVTDLAAAQSRPAVSQLAGHDIAVAFQTPGGGGSDIYVQRLHSDLSPAGLDVIDTSASATSFPAITEVVGGYAVAYTRGTGGDTDIVAHIVSQDGVVGAPFDIHNETDNSGNVELAMLTGGTCVAVYQDEEAGDHLNTQIEYRVFTSTGVLVGASHNVLGGADAAAESDPDVARLNEGFVVVWTDGAGDASGEGIRATVYNFSGGARRADFLVNTSQAGNQNEASVAPLDDGGFVVTWEDDFANVVRAQRFDLLGNMVGSEFIVHQGTTGPGSPDVGGAADGQLGFAIDDQSTGNLDVVTSVWDAGVPSSNDDILWQHVEGALAGDGRVFGHASSDWQVRGTGDFDHDGDRDILWQHTGGLVVTWEIQGIEYVVNHNLGDVGGAWHIRGTGDFDGDGDDDILWHHDDGLIVTWEMEDGNLVTNHNLASVGNGWEIAGTGDFDADGDADLLWRSTDGLVVTWEMEGGALVTNHNFASVPTNWQIRGTGDFDADGDADILWHHDEGLVVSWEMEGGDYVANHSLPDVASTWRVSGTSDFDDDGDAEILWRHEDGLVVSWEMQGGAFVAIDDSLLVGNGWQIRGTLGFDLA